MTQRFLVPLIALAVVAPHAHAQIRASERGTVSQMIDGTTITIDYGRPQVRGRDDLWGGVTPWGKVWTPGANWATTIDVDKDIRINGHELSTGTYSMWFEVQPDEWTVILDPEPRRFHLIPPGESADQLRFTVHPETRTHVELLAWWFPEVWSTGATLQMAWGTLGTTFDIGVKPSRPVTATADVAERIVGSYRFAAGPVLGGQTAQFDISFENDHIVARWENSPVPKLARFWLAPIGAGMFNPVELEGDEIFGVVTDLVFEFTPLEGQATMFELRALGDVLWGSGERTR